MRSESETSLFIHVVSATELISVQTVGKQDPFFQYALNYEKKDNFVKTFTHKNAGETATWNQTFTVPLNGEPDLFVEVLDEEFSVDEVIGFAAIPINQVVYAEGAYLNGLFELFNTKGERAGFINLQLAAQGLPNSLTPNFDSEPVQGQSYVHEGHCQRMKSSEKKATGVSIAGSIFGGALAIGAGLLVKKLYDDHQEEEEAKRVQEEEEAQRLQEKVETARREADEKRQQEREESEQERAEFEREKAERDEEETQEDEVCERESRRHEHDGEESDGDHGYERRNSNSFNDDDDDENAENWNPVGTYAAGDRVKYHGQVYVCLQDHTTNPTWQPSVAHSLWQTE